MRVRGGRNLVVLLFLVVLVNLPLAHTTYVDHQVRSDGVLVQATVTDTGTLPGHADTRVVDFRFDQHVDPGQRDWSAQVDQPTYDLARRTRLLAVRVVPGKPSHYLAAGQVDSHVDVAITVVADGLIAMFAGLLWGFRNHQRRGVLHLVALSDVTRAKPGGSVERLEDTTYVVIGEVSEIASGHVVLDCGDRRVHIDLGDHTNPVGYQQPAQVRGRLSESQA